MPGVYTWLVNLGIVTMYEHKRRKDRLVALAVLGLVAMNYPLLSVFGGGVFVFGVPIVFFYIFGFWLLFVVLIAWAFKR